MTPILKLLIQGVHMYTLKVIDVQKRMASI